MECVANIFQGVSMRYFFALLLPPVAVLMCGKPGQFVFNCVLTLFFYIPGMIHAIYVVNAHLSDPRNQLLDAMKR